MAPQPRRTGWPEGSMRAGRSRPRTEPFGLTTTSATAVMVPAGEKSGHTKLPRPQKIGRFR